MGSSPWSNQAVSLILLTEETTGLSGLFGYSPTPGAGNLIFSISASSGTDSYGNLYSAGVTSYSSSLNALVNILSNNINFGAISAGSSSPAIVKGDPGFIEIFSGTTSSSDTEAGIQINSNLSSGAPGGNGLVHVEAGVTELDGYLSIGSEVGGFTPSSGRCNIYYIAGSPGSLHAIGPSGTVINLGNT